MDQAESDPGTGRTRLQAGLIVAATLLATAAAWAVFFHLPPFRVVVSTRPVNALVPPGSVLAGVATAHAERARIKGDSRQRAGR